MPADAQEFSYWLNRIQKTVEGRKSTKRRRDSMHRDKVAGFPPVPARRPRVEFFDGKHKVVLRRDGAKPAARNLITRKNSGPDGGSGWQQVRAIDPRQVPAVRPAIVPPARKGGLGKTPQAGKPIEEPRWRQAEIDEALKTCARIIKSVNAIAIPEQPIKKGGCGAPAPVKLISIGRKKPVKFRPAVTVNCPMVAALAKWIEKDLQPLAKRHLGARITTVETMSSYSCRRAYGRVNARLSEHAFANAIDIRGFKTDNGQSTRLLAHWGTTARDVRKKLIADMKKREAEAKKRVRVATTGAPPTVTKSSAPSAPVAKPIKPALTPAPSGSSQAPSRANRASLGAGKGNSAKAKKKITTIDLKAVKAPPPSTQEARFLHAAHRRACKIFGTVLGPEANEAHRNHFHVDLAYRKRSNYCR